MDVDDEATQDEIIKLDDADDSEEEDVKPAAVTPAETEAPSRVANEGSKKPKVRGHCTCDDHSTSADPRLDFVDHVHPGRAVQAPGTRASAWFVRDLTFRASLRPTDRPARSRHAGIKVIGFQDSLTLNFDHNVKHSYFIYPDEEAYIGSTRTFTALLRNLLDKDKIGITRCVYRKGSSPLMCAMVPQVRDLSDIVRSRLRSADHSVPLRSTGGDIYGRGCSRQAAWVPHDPVPVHGRHARATRKGQGRGTGDARR